MALLPISILSIWQGVDRIRSDQQIVSELLRQSALAAASDEENVFTNAQQLLQSLATQDDIRLGRPGCQRRLAESIHGVMFVGNLTRVSSDGAILCAVTTPPASFDVTKMSWWTEALTQRDFFVSGPFYSQALRKNAFAAVLPLTRADGTFDGMIYGAIDIDWLTFVHKRQAKLKRGTLVALFDRTGSVVASNAPAIAAVVFANGGATGNRQSGLRSATGPNGEAWSLSIAPVLRHDYFIGFAMKDSELSRLSYEYVALDLVVPVLMILLASLAIWWATSLFVVRWIEQLSQMATSYAKGEYVNRPQAFNKAPQEFFDLGNTMSDMAQTIQQRDKSLTEAVAHKDVLIKEMHHRVKNTLQIVLSLLSLQAKRLRDPSAREAIEQTRARINALALGHRVIDEADADGLVDLGPLLVQAVELARRCVEDADNQLNLSMDIAPCLASSDIAIPLALFINEAMTCAFEHAGPEQAKSHNVAISLRPATNGRMDLIVSDDGQRRDANAGNEDTAMRARLMKALAQQVSGELSMAAGDAGRTVISLNFAARSQDPSKVA